MKQQSFSSHEQAHKKKRTKRESFLGEMDAVVPWARLEALIAPHYTKPRKGRPQMPLSVMLRIYFMQQWYDLSDPGPDAKDERAVVPQSAARIPATEKTILGTLFKSAGKIACLAGVSGHPVTVDHPNVRPRRFKVLERSFKMG